MYLPGWRRHVGRTRSTTRTLPLRPEIDDVLELMRMVAAGLGVALLPPSIVTDADLRTVAIHRHAPVHHVAVAVPTVRRPSAATRALLGAIRAHPR
jgi:DNA-binding transcriptional LysR family regulator